MKKHSSHQHNSPHNYQPVVINRREAAFVSSTVLIGIIFLVALIGVITGKFKPSADQVASGTLSGGSLVTTSQLTAALTLSDGFPVCVTTQTVSCQLPAALDLSGRTVITAQPFNQAILNDITIQIPLQGLEGRIANTPDIAGAVAVQYSGKSTTDSWKSTGNAGDSSKQASLSAKISRAFTSNPAPYTLVVKPNYYLATSITNITSPQLVAAMPVALAGDIDGSNDNVINLADWSQFSTNYGHVVTSANGMMDFNGDGQIDLLDFSIFSGNYGKTGVSL